MQDKLEKLISKFQTNQSLKRDLFEIQDSYQQIVAENSKLRNRVNTLLALVDMLKAELALFKNTAQKTPANYSKG
jgi:hypothetical protein